MQWKILKAHQLKKQTEDLSLKETEMSKCCIRGGATSQVDQVFIWLLLLSYRWSKIYRCNYRKYFYKYFLLYINRLYVYMYGQCLLSLTASLPHMWKMPLYSIIFTRYFICLPCLHVALFCPFLLWNVCWSFLTWTTWRASPASFQLSFLKDLWPEETCALQPELLGQVV